MQPHACACLRDERLRQRNVQLPVRRASHKEKYQADFAEASRRDVADGS